MDALGMKSTIGIIAKCQISWINPLRPKNPPWDERKRVLSSRLSRSPWREDHCGFRAPSSPALASSSRSHPFGNRRSRAKLRDCKTTTSAAAGRLRLRGPKWDGMTTFGTDAAYAPTSEGPVVWPTWDVTAVTLTSGLRKAACRREKEPRPAIACNRGGQPKRHWQCIPPSNSYRPLLPILKPLHVYTDTI